MAVTSKPKLKKTSINLGNFGGKSDLGNVSPFQSKVSSASHIKSLQSQRRVLERVITLEEDVENLNTRVQMQDESLLSVKSEFQQSLSHIQQRVGTLESGQKAIIDNARNKEKILEKQRKLEEARIKREGAEKSLEDPGQPDKDTDQKGAAAEKESKKSMGILDRLKKFLTFVVAGWFTDKTFKLIEAFQSGNQKQIRKIGLKLLAGAAAVGSIMLLAAGAIGPVLAGIGSLIGVLAGLLFNPVTLTALLIAVGIGGAIMGIRALWKWGRKKKLGGEGFRDKHDELDKQLKEAGMDKDGKVKNEEGKWVRTTDPEQLKILEQVEAEREQLKDLKKDMKKDVKDSKKEYFDKVRAGEPKGWGKGKERKEYWNKARKDWAEKEKAMYADYNKKALDIGGTKGDGSNVGSSAPGKNAAGGLGPPESTEGNISVIPNFVEGMDKNLPKGMGEQPGPITSGNSDNRYLLDAKLQYNTFV